MTVSELRMSPRTNTVLRRSVGDRLRFTLQAPDAPADATAWLRCNIGLGQQQRRAVIDAVEGRRMRAQQAWHSLPMQRQGDEWQCDLTLTEPGCYAAKCYLEDGQGQRLWPHGDNVYVTVHPADYRAGNTIYCAFPRMFRGEKRGVARDPMLQSVMRGFDEHGFAVIPPSGKLRELAASIPHIVDRLGCRIIHLLPINPTPTTFARYGRYGSPYAALDFTAIDPALIEHDRRSTPEQQFAELADQVHHHGAKLFIDLAINHTGWGSTLQNEHPEWFKRASEDPQRFISPGAWGVTWEDLSELDYEHRELWEYIAKCFLVWCRRGVDGFRCDAGYMVPLPAWEFIIAKVQERFPDTIFLLEGLGGAWEITEQLLTTGGMQWCYSELFQNYDAASINGYLAYALEMSATRGLWIHYAETHDNLRLAAEGKAWSLFRNRLCGLCASNGGYGFTNGVEWLASEKLEVHGACSLNWNASEHICNELATLNHLLADHPAFRDGARLRLISTKNEPVVILERIDPPSSAHVLILANPDREQKQRALIPAATAGRLGTALVDLLDQELPLWQGQEDGDLCVTLPPLSIYALAPASPHTWTASGEGYRRRRALHAWGVQILGDLSAPHLLPTCAWEELADLVDEDPLGFLAAAMRQDPQAPITIAGLRAQRGHASTPRLSRWRARDASRVLPLPDHHCLVVQHEAPFTVNLQKGRRVRAHKRSVATDAGHIAVFLPEELHYCQRLRLHDIASSQDLIGHLRLLNPDRLHPQQAPIDGSVLLTNGRGGMCFMPVIPHCIQSKYHCLLATNAHPRVPCDRQVLAKRLRAWIAIDGFTTPLDDLALIDCQPGPPARWRWAIPSADGSRPELVMQIDMAPGANCVAIRFEHDPSRSPGQLSLIVRIDIEDRSYHGESHLSDPAAQDHFRTHIRTLGADRGFAFTPSADRRLEVWSDHGHYQAEEEICFDIPHPIEATRGQVAVGDAYAPGFFTLPLDEVPSCCLILNAERISPRTDDLYNLPLARAHTNAIAIERSRANDWFGQALTIAAQSYVVRRDDGKTVIAGYPWFLDWGRDTLICARGLLAAGLDDDVGTLLRIFGRFEDGGTLPNCIFGDDASNRDTVDAPLWYGVVAADLARRRGPALYDQTVSEGGRSIRAILTAIATGYLRGTANGIRVDPASGLIWSPSHFTWMDTNHPAGTPRQGYPIEIQALWIHLLRLLAELDQAPAADQAAWADLAARAEESLDALFWHPRAGYYGDCLHASSTTPASNGLLDDALRSNALIAIALGILTGERARATVTAARDWLIVPGAIRSLAPRRLAPPLHIRDAKGRELVNPQQPYAGHYEGDEDSRRKPAYHNGTAWTWPFPVFCEAYARAFDLDPEAIASARAYMASMADLLHAGCLGQIPEICDGDAPHTQRGCLAQAWGVTEALRVWRWLEQL